ncbi:hypothetical protein Q4489_05720 [Thalassotalea sp. 1_MG-2023]|uniref:hypothetical protein n=1 Tax=Thalassotalea sp. 1_MG-2023 TaxID=3062680 RepID=UPI0026E3B835|nr:hypothetical protein [Thalassotalea sp. 1_MG-2023]MDO6426501.1 hypothetical protein [Thalassotalea sp. 1_MG-2023]
MSSVTRKNLLLIVALLAVIRFVIVPIFEWQEEKIDDIDAKITRLDKAENVINRQAKLTTLLSDVQQSNEETEVLYHNFTSTNAMKLSLQQQVEKIFSQHSVKIKNFTWPNELPGNITELRAKVFFDGNTKDLAKLHLALSAQTKLFNIAEWTIHIRKMKEDSLGVASGSLVFSAYNLSSKKVAE